MSINRSYAGIGSRRTPREICEVMCDLGESLGSVGYVLRSGAAIGADSAFENGCDIAYGEKEIYLPKPVWRGRTADERGVYFMKGNRKEAAELAAASWKDGPGSFMCLPEWLKSYHIRNTYQVLGMDLDDPVDFVLYWTPIPETGGTTQALRMARARNIPCLRVTETTTLRV